jgi:hypothetical protein
MMKFLERRVKVGDAVEDFQGEHLDLESLEPQDGFCPWGSIFMLLPGQDEAGFEYPVSWGVIGVVKEPYLVLKEAFQLLLLGFHE